MTLLQWIGISMVLFNLWILYRQNYQTILKKTALKKLRVICKREFRNEIDQLSLIVNQYIEEYAKSNNIDWEKEL